MSDHERVAVFGDIHANLPALEAVWADMDDVERAATGIERSELPDAFAGMLREGTG